MHSSDTGRILSPKYPSNYPTNVSCRYLIKNSNPAARITVKFLQSKLQGDSSCRFDSLKIYDGETTNAAQLGRTRGYCGNRRPPTLTSTGKALLIIFTSDQSVTSSGYVISYSTKGTFQIFLA